MCDRKIATSQCNLPVTVLINSTNVNIQLFVPTSGGGESKSQKGGNWVDVH